MLIKHKILANFWLQTFVDAGYRALICNTCEDDVIEAVRIHSPTILFIEASFADKQGFELARQAKQIHPALHCVVCLPVVASYYATAIQINISGYLPEGIDDSAEVLMCFDRINQGYRYISDIFQQALYLPSHQDTLHTNSLTEKQKQILGLVAEGFTSKQIAHQLNLSQSTVQNHKERISKLVGLKGVYQLKIFSGSVAHLL